MYMELPFFVDINSLLSRGSFSPLSGTTYAEKINSTARFVIILVLMVSLYHYDVSLFCVAAFILVCGSLYLADCGKGGLSPARLSPSRLSPSRLSPDRLSPARLSPTGRETFGEAAPKTRAGCTRPTAQNPFMNVMLADIAENPDRPRACPIDSVKDEVDDHFYRDLYRDAGDLYQTKSNERQFYTMPNSMVAADQTAFAKSLFGSSGKLKALGQRYYSPS